MGADVLNHVALATEFDCEQASTLSSEVGDILSKAKDLRSRNQGRVYRGESLNQESSSNPEAEGLSGTVAL